MRNKTIVVGCGRLGASIASYASSQGEDVIVLDSRKDAFTKLSETFSGYTIACDATEIDELEDAGIRDARELILTTGDDNINLYLAHLCLAKYNVPYIYVRFDDPEKGFLIQGMPIKAIYPFQLSRDRFSLLQQGDDGEGTL